MKVTIRKDTVGYRMVMQMIETQQSFKKAVKEGKILEWAKKQKESKLHRGV